jgi:hypothetical protein
MRPPRWILVPSYLTFALAGMFFMLWRPTLQLESLLGHFGFFAWNLFLVFGGLIGAAGAGWRKFRIEIISSPLLFAGLAVYGGSILARIPNPDTKNPGVLAGLGTIFIGSGLLFLGKGLAIWFNKIRVADDIHRRADGIQQ